MSYDLSAYIQSDQLPPFSDLRQRAEKVGVVVKLPETTELASIRGVVPVVYEGTECGFEITCGRVTEQRIAGYKKRLERSGNQPGEYLEMLTTCDRFIVFACTASNAREITAARIVASIVASAGKGWFRDEQSSTVIRYAKRPNADV
jgi:hypothetical protein